MRFIKNHITVFIIFAFGLGQVNYNSDIQPIFNSSCTSCHGGSGGLSLTSYNNVMNGGNSGEVVIAFDHANSILWQYVNSGFMPPSAIDLTQTQIDFIAQWIDEGAFEDPAGCTDPEAYTCQGSLNGDYLNNIGVIVYDYSCNGSTDAGSENCSDGEVCYGYYNPTADVDNGTCYYYQAPSVDEIIFTIATGSITLDWSDFTPPSLANVINYHLQRCVGDACTPFNTELTNFTDNVEWNSDDDLKYVISVNYENNIYWGWANSEPLYPFDECPEMGNINGDTDGTGQDIWNVLDIVMLANCVLAQNCAELPYSCAGDLNNDGGYNVLDIVTLANCVLAGTCGGRIDDAIESRLIMVDNVVSIEADGFIGGVQMTLTHGTDFSIEMTDRALYSNYVTEGNETRLLVITPETEDLFSYNGDFEIAEIIVANSYAEVSVDLPGENEISNDLYISTVGIIEEYNLSTAYPNPFNPITMLTLAVPISGHVSVQVYNLSGQVVATLANEYMGSNTYNTLSWDASDAPSGMYFVKAQADEFTTTQKLMLVK